MEESREYEKRTTIASRIVDSNEPCEIRTKLLEIGWEQRRLHSADYMIITSKYQKVGLERKEINDLMSSIGDRLARQLEAMLDYYDINILMIEGSWKTISPQKQIITGRGISYYTWDMVWNFLRRWQDKGVSIELTINEGHTIQRLSAIYALYQKDYSMSARAGKFADERILAFPSGVRGKTGENILKGHSLGEIAGMSVETLQKYEKVGEKKAKLIYSHFHRGENNENEQEQKLI
jgi:ERCC4-type nuclease